MENDFLAMKKFCPWPKTHFPSNSQANMYFFSKGKKFVLGQKYFVQEDGRGISLYQINGIDAVLSEDISPCIEVQK